MELSQLSVPPGLIKPVITCTIEGILETEDLRALASGRVEQEEAGVALAPVEEVENPKDLKRIKEKHHMVARLVASGMMLMVSRHVTGPLRTIRDAMLKLAGGDFEVVLPGLTRKDEIGAVANAVEQFKTLAFEKARGEADELVQRQQAEARSAQAQAEAQARAAEERARAADEQARAFDVLGVGLGKLTEGDFTFRLSDEIPEAYKPIDVIMRDAADLVEVRHELRQIVNVKGN